MDTEIEVAVSTGTEVKALGDGRVGGYLVRFTGPRDPDLTGDFFSKDTDLGVEDGSILPVYYNHGGDGTLKTRKLGRAVVKFDDAGLWLEAQLNMRDEYEQMIYKLATEGKLGWSSGAAGHLVEREKVGKTWHIKSWPIAEASLTPTPAEARNDVEVVKSVPDEVVEQQADDEAGEVSQTAAHDAPSDTECQEVNLEKSEDALGGAQMDETVKAELDGMKSSIDELKTLLSAALAPKEEPKPEAEPQGVVMKGAPALKRVTDLGFKDEAVKAFMHYAKTGEVVKAALQEDTETEGGVVVPDDFYAKIAEKRNLASWIRQAPVQHFTTSRDKIIIGAEDTAATKFVVVAEEGAWDENEPNMATVTVEIHKMTKIIKASEELVADAAVNIEAYLASVFGRSMALAENYYYTVGNGVNMPLGVLAGATSSGITTAAAAAITAAELVSLVGKLGGGYNIPPECGFLMQNATFWYLRGLTGNPFQFIPTPAGGVFAGYPGYVSDDMEALTNSKKATLFGNFSFYAHAEREGLVVKRLNELYAANGQIGFRAHFRAGGSVTQAEAFYYMTQHA